MSTINQILIIRLSALGDVAMTVPVITQLVAQNPEQNVVILTKSNMKGLFEDIKGIQIVAPDFKKDYIGIFGILKLFLFLRRNFNITKIIDLHNVLRTKILTFLFAVCLIKTFRIEKGRNEKQKLTRQKNKIRTQLKHSTTRYADVLYKAGYKFNLTHNFKTPIQAPVTDLIQLFKLNTADKKIGIAPFAFHKQKMYPLEKMEKVIAELNKYNLRIYIFGGGTNEKITAEEWQNKYDKVTSLIGKIKMADEIKIINSLNLMITMDSANMHLAALTNTKIISIWGATHHFAGFSAYTETDKNIIIQQDNIDCRPCSVFGNKKCYKKTIECLTSINEEIIINQIILQLNN